MDKQRNFARSYPTFISTLKPSPPSQVFKEPLEFSPLGLQAKHELRKILAKPAETDIHFVLSFGWVFFGMAGNAPRAATVTG